MVGVFDAENALIDEIEAQLEYLELYPEDSLKHIHFVAITVNETAIRIAQYGVMLEQSAAAAEFARSAALLAAVAILEPLVFAIYTYGRRGNIAPHIHDDDNP